MIGMWYKYITYMEEGEGEMTKTVGLYLRSETEQEILARGGNRSNIINRDLERLYTLYRRALREVCLSLNEACLIADALNGTIMDAATAPMLWGSIEDAIKLDGLAKKWDVDGPALVEKLRSLSAFHCMALVDAAERCWQVPDTSFEETVRKCFMIGG